MERIERDEEVRVEGEELEEAGSSMPGVTEDALLHRDPAYLYCSDTGCQVFIHTLQFASRRDVNQHLSKELIMKSKSSKRTQSQG